VTPYTPHPAPNPRVLNFRLPYTQTHSTGVI
jgi:hypothetical protein